MADLSAEQIATHAYRAGFRGDALSTAVAVAMAESGGDPRAHNGTAPDNSYGLWQVNMLGEMGEKRREAYGIDSNDELYKPEENAKAAYQIYKEDGNSFGPWSTYDSNLDGKPDSDAPYKKHLDEARQAAEAVTKRHGKPSGGGNKKPSDGNSGNGGFRAVPERLMAYQKAADGIADRLEQTGKKTVAKVTGIAKDSFGKVGEETGFSDALADFSKALEKQVRATGTTTRELGEATAASAKTYGEIDDAHAAEFKRLMK